MTRIPIPGAAAVRDQAAQLFAQSFGHPAACVALAPGRVNLIGEHVDYNDGVVLPFALDLQIGIAFSPSDTGRARLISTTDSSIIEYPLGNHTQVPWQGWARYIQGVLQLWQQRQGIQSKGFELAVYSSLPMGAGLSSSAALCIAAVFALQQTIRPAPLPDQSRLATLELAQLCQQVEHQFAGVRCGLMDQLASLACLGNHLLAIDFRGPVLEQIPWPGESLHCLLVHTGVQHELAASEYGSRRAECESAATKLGLKSLRDCSSDLLERGRSELSPSEFLRARHVVSEIDRTTSALAACRRGDASELGTLMDTSHRSLREDYQVSCPELDFLVETIRGLPGVYGARMTGGGFGGSMIALLQPQGNWQVQLEQLLSSYRERFGLEPRWMLGRPGSGAEQLNATPDRY